MLNLATPTNLSQKKVGWVFDTLVKKKKLCVHASAMMSMNTSSGWHITSAGAFVDTTGKGALFLFALTEKNNSSSLRESCLQKKCRRATVQSRMSVLKSNFCFFFFLLAKKFTSTGRRFYAFSEKSLVFAFFSSKKQTFHWIGSFCNPRADMLLWQVWNFF